MQLNLLEQFEIEQPEVDSDNWFTPKWLIEIAREVMGGIDLDPASCTQANTIVKASRFYTQKDDGLTKDWHGRVWCNPPYSMPLIEKFTLALVTQVAYGHTTQGFMLSRNATETKWCQKLLTRCDRFCLLNRRVTFWYPGKPKGTDKCGHILFYFGSNTIAFEQLTKGHGLTFKGVIS